MDKTKLFTSVSDFLNDDSFITWRLFRTEEAEQQWQSFAIEHPQALPLLKEACRTFDAIRLNEIRLTEGEKALQYEKIRTRIRTYQQTRQRRWLYGAVAAASFLLLVSISVTLLMQRKGAPPTIVCNEVAGKILPSEHVQLISGDETVTLQSHTSIAVSKSGEASVIDRKSNVQALRLPESKQNKLIVPYGKRSSMTLADGTKVWLNSGTEFTFPSRFTGPSREVRVKGEIYIEVAHNTRPFLVHTPQAVIRVTGTRFNISAYAGDAKENVVLLSGKVQVDMQNQPALELLPCEMAIISSDQLTKTTVDTTEYVGWQNGIMTFNKTPMSQVLKKIGRYYNISFEEGSGSVLKGKTVSGKLYLSDNPHHVMTSICALSSTEYKWDKDHIFIHKKQELPMKKDE